MMEKQVKVVVSKKEPQNKHVLWLEQDALHEISPKLFNNGEWQNLKTVNVPEELLNKVGELNDNVKEFDREVENFSSDITSFRNSLITETQQRMAVDSSLGNRITSVTTTANNNKTSLNNLETKLNTNFADLRAKDAELEEAISNEVTSRRNEVDSLQSSIRNVGNRVSTTESQIVSLQDNVVTLQSEVTNVKNDVVPKAVAEGIAKVVANAPEDLNTLKEVADYIAADKTKAAEIETAISDLKVATQTNYGEIQQVKHDAEGTLSMVLDNSRAIQQHTKDIDKNAKDVTSNTQAINLLAEAVETKAPKVGYAPGLKVDFAKELVGRGVAEPQEIGTIRPTGVISIGDGNATIEKIKGKSVVWNQIALSRISTAAYTYGNGEITILDAGKSDFNQNAYKIASFVKSRKYLITKKSDAPLQIYNYYDAGVALSSKQTYGFLGPFTYNWIFTLGFVNAELGTYKAEIRIYDLTQMFGAGNEPTTIEEFEARRPLGVSNDYNEGEIISYDGANELKSVGFNAFNGTYAKVIGGEEYHATGTTSVSFAKELDGATTAITLNSENKFIPEEDGYVYAEGTNVVIHLTHSYTPRHVNEYEEDILTLPDVKSIKGKDGNQLFPYGLLSAGSAHDEITATKAIKRIHAVDMGGLIWRISPSGYFYASLLPIRPISRERNVNYNEICAKYTSLSFNDFSKTDTNKAMCVYYAYEFGINVKDTAYTDATTFKQAMKGVMLYYIIATPIEVDLPEPLNLTYDAWDFGTEELVAEGKTTPLNADIVYQFNAVDRIRENTSNVSEIEEEVATKQEELTLTVLDNGNIRIGNLQGQTKDFMPATPSGDPMHYAYEAMGAVWNGTGKDIVYDASVDYTLAEKKDKKPFFLDWGDSYTHKAGYWLMNEVGDLNNADMREILLSRPPLRPGDTKAYWMTKKQRTNKPNSINVGSSATAYRSVACNASEIQVLSFCTEKRVTIKTNDIHYAFSPASKLKKITNEFSIKEAERSTYAFYSCPNLEYIKFSELSTNICIQCPKLHKQSVKWLIEHETGEKTKTIELHPDVYATLSQDADIQAALEAHPLVTITPYES